MDARATRRGVPAVVIWSGFGALAWAALTIFMGGSAAQADEQPDGPLDGLTSLVHESVSAVTAPVAPVVTQVVSPVVTQVVAPVVTAVVAPVQQTAPAVVDTVTTTVTTTAQGVVAPVTDVLTDSPIAQITDPILDAVTGLPVVGDVVTDLGVIDLVDDVVGIVDDTTGVIGGVVEETVPPVLEALDPTVPGGSDGTTRPNGPSSSPDGVPAMLATPSTNSASLHATDLGFASAEPPALPAAASAMVTGEPEALRAVGDASSGAPPGAPVAPSSSAGPGGGSSSAHARLSDVGAPPSPAGERESGASDDALPASPVADTDVSPD